MPSLTGIVLESCSIIDAIFRDGYEPATKTKDANIGNFAEYYDDKFTFSAVRTVVYHYPAHLRRPFETWSTASGPRQSPQWWKAYNALKHNRLASYKLSTFGTAIEALCALHQVISQMPVFLDALFRHDMICFGSWGHTYALGVIRTRDHSEDLTLLIESELFGTPVGKHEFGDSIDNPPYWSMSTGRKFGRAIGRPLH